MRWLNTYGLGIGVSESEFLALSPSGYTTLVPPFKLPRLGFLICKVEMLIESKIWSL